MTSTPHLHHHLTLSQELHQLALEENQFLKTQKRIPDTAFLERKRTLLTALDHSLTALKQANQSRAASTSSAHPDPERADTVEKTRAKLLQILHLDRENEQLLLRYSLGSPRQAAAPAAPAPTSPSHIRRLYERLG